MVMFGFHFNPSFLIGLYCCLGLVILIGILLVALLVHMSIGLKNIKKTSNEKINFRRRVIIMLHVRTLTPFLFGIIPLLLVFVLVHAVPEESYIIGCLMISICSSVGFWTCIATIFVFKPFREALILLIKHPKKFFKKKNGKFEGRAQKSLIFTF